MDKLRMETPDLTAENVEKIAALFPNCVTEMVDEARSTDDTIVYKKGINFAVLKQMLSDAVVDGGEAYEFTWVGKKAAMVEANRPIRKTLRPCPEESKDWDTTENLYIEGDNLEVLKLLQESYLNKVKMIYIDPPYNTGNDFIYADNFMRTQDEENRQMGMFDEEENRLFKNTDSNGRFHSDWCSMMYSRLLLARNLLTEDGVIFISIDDNEVENLKKMCNEIFGENNFMTCFPRVTKKAGKSSEAISKNHDYVLMFSKSSHPTVYLPEHDDEGFKYSDEFVFERGFYKLNQTLDYDSLQYSASLDYPIEIEGEVFYPGQSYEKYLERQQGKHARADWAWRWSKELFDFGYQNGFIEIKRYENHSRIYTKTYQRCKIVKGPRGFEIEYAQRTRAITSLDFIENEFSNDNSKKNLLSLFESSVFDYSKPLSLLRKLTQYATKNEDVILDFFSGSATTAHAVMQMNAGDGGHRKFIMVQLPEVCDEKSEAAKAGYKTICDIGKERIRRAGAIIKKEHALTAPFEKTGQTAMYYDDMKPYMEEASADFDAGFRVLKLDESNMKDVFYAPEELSQKTMYDMVSNIRDGRTGLDLLFGCLLDWGLSLSLPFSSETLDGCTVYTYNDGDLIACFDENVPESVVTAIARRKPLRAVFRDGCFASSPEKINVVEIFKNYAPTCAVKVL